MVPIDLGGLFSFFFLYNVLYAFDFTKELGISGLIAFTMVVSDVAVPVQGAIGPRHFMVIATTVCSLM